MKYSYQAEKFSSARRSLMLPHAKGETASIADAFAECVHGTTNLELADLDDNAKELLRKLNELIDPVGLKDPADRGLYAIKAEKLTIEQRRELSAVVDELATWFDLRTRCT
jgi:hypothetical protein